MDEKKIMEWNECAVHYIKKIDLLSKVFLTKKNEIFFSFILKRHDMQFIVGDPNILIGIMTEIQDMFTILKPVRDMIKESIGEAIKLLRTFDESGLKKSQIYKDLNSTGFNANKMIEEYDKELDFVYNDFSDNKYHYKED